MENLRLKQGIIASANKIRALYQSYESELMVDFWPESQVFDQACQDISYFIKNSANFSAEDLQEHLQDIIYSSTLQLESLSLARKSIDPRITQVLVSLGQDSDLKLELEGKIADYLKAQTNQFDRQLAKDFNATCMGLMCASPEVAKESLKQKPENGFVNNEALAVAESIGSNPRAKILRKIAQIATLAEQVNEVKQAVGILAQKADNLQSRSYRYKAELLREKANDIHSSANQYFDEQLEAIKRQGSVDQNSTKRFRVQCEAIINRNSDYFAEHSDVKSMLAQALLKVVSVLSLGIVPLVNKAFTGSFVMHRTASEKTIAQAQQDIGRALSR